MASGGPARPCDIWVPRTGWLCAIPAPGSVPSGGVLHLQAGPQGTRAPALLTFPQGHGQDGSPGLEAFHRAKSLGERFSLRRSAETLRSPAVGGAGQGHSLRTCCRAPSTSPHGCSAAGPSHQLAPGCPLEPLGCDRDWCDRVDSGRCCGLRSTHSHARAKPAPGCRDALQSMMPTSPCLLAPWPSTPLCQATMLWAEARSDLV